jgi:hypothetical protein
MELNFQASIDVSAETFWKSFTDSSPEAAKGLATTNLSGLVAIPDYQ